MELKVIVWEELDAENELFDVMWPVFASTNHEVDLDMDEFMVLNSPWTHVSEEFTSELTRLGFADGYLPRGAGNADTAFYALDMREFYDHDIVRVALIDVA